LDGDDLWELLERASDKTTDFGREKHGSFIYLLSFILSGLSHQSITQVLELTENSRYNDPHTGTQAARGLFMAILEAVHRDSHLDSHVDRQDGVKLMIYSALTGVLCRLLRVQLHTPYPTGHPRRPPTSESVTHPTLHLNNPLHERDRVNCNCSACRSPLR
jgi:hypothetical protein